MDAPSSSPTVPCWDLRVAQLQSLVDIWSDNVTLTDYICYTVNVIHLGADVWFFFQLRPLWKLPQNTLIQSAAFIITKGLFFLHSNTIYLWWRWGHVHQLNMNVTVSWDSSTYLLASHWRGITRHVNLSLCEKSFEVYSQWSCHLYSSGVDLVRLLARESCRNQKYTHTHYTTPSGAEV